MSEAPKKNPMRASELDRCGGVPTPERALLALDEIARAYQDENGQCLECETYPAAADATRGHYRGDGFACSIAVLLAFIADAERQECVVDNLERAASAVVDLMPGESELAMVLRNALSALRDAKG